MSELRIRLEGRLELLEETARDLERLVALASDGWEENAAELIVALDAWAESAAQRDDAKQVVARDAGAKAWVDDVALREAHLCIRLDALLEGTAVPRCRTLDAKLKTWAELARSLGPARELEPVSAGEGVVRSREWMLSFVAAAVVLAVKQPVLALLLAPLGAVWWDFCKSKVKWRLFRDVLEIAEPDRPVRRVPLDSIEELQADAVVALWDVSLKGESGFHHLNLDLRRAVAERTTRSRYAGHREHALWMPSSLHSGDPARAQHGWVVSCEAGMVFVPDTATPLAWVLAVGAHPLETKGDIGPELRNLPARLLEDKVESLAKLKGCVKLSGLQQAAYQSLGEILLVVVDEERKVFIRCSLSTQAKVLERVR